MTNVTDLTNPIALRYSKEKDVIFITGSLVISILILATNTPVICLYCWKRRCLLKIQSNRLLLSLSICNFLSGIGIVFYTLRDLLPMFENPTTTLGYTYRIILDIYIAFLVMTNVMHLCGVTLDRYISLFYAFRYQCIVTKKSIKRYIIVAWVIPLIASSIQLSWLYKVIVGYLAEDDIKTIFHIEIWYSVVLFTIFFVIPFVLLAVAFFAMFLEIRRVVRSTPRHRLAGEMLKQRRVIFVFALMYLSFVFLAMPYFSLRLLVDVYFWTGKDIQFNRVVVQLAILLKYLTSIISPVLYTGTSREFTSLLNQVRRKFTNSISIDEFRYSYVQKHSSVNGKFNIVEDTGGNRLLIKCTNI